MPKDYMEPDIESKTILSKPRNKTTPVWCVLLK